MVPLILLYGGAGLVLLLGTAYALVAMGLFLVLFLFQIILRWKFLPRA